MKDYLTCLILFFSLISISCSSSEPKDQVDEGSISEDKYTSEEIGWTINIPKGWDIVEMEEIEENNQKGQKALEETLGTEVDYSGLKNLIAFRKDLFNVFQSSSEPFELEYEGEWEENNAAIKEIVYYTYLNNGMKTDSSETTIEKIDGLEFQKYTFTIYSDEGDFILGQTMYNRLINGYDFAVNLNFNNQEDEQIMLEAWKNSRFERR